MNQSSGTSCLVHPSSFIIHPLRNGNHSRSLGCGGAIPPIGQPDPCGGDLSSGSASSSIPCRCAASNGCAGLPKGRPRRRHSVPPPIADFRPQRCLLSLLSRPGLSGRGQDGRGPGQLPAGPASQARLRRSAQQSGQCTQGSRSIGEAVARYKDAIHFKPDFAEAHNNLGNALQEQGQLAEAVAHYREALRLKPDYADAYYNLGITLKEQGQLAEAVAQYQEALRLKPDYAEAH